MNGRLLDVGNRWRSRDLTFACNLADVLIEYFEDHDNGGFYFTSNDHERLIQRRDPIDLGAHL